MREPICTGALLLLAGCGTVDPRPDQEHARDLIRESTGRAEIFDPDAPPLAPPEIAAITADGLSLDETLRLALLNNQRLQAGFMRLGIARAEFVQAGLLKNPSLGLAFLFPSGGGRTRIGADLTQNIVELWELPAREKIAGGALEREVLDLSRFAGELVADTKNEYFQSVAAREVRAVAGESLELARRSFDAVRGRVTGGVATSLDENLAQSQLLAAELAFRAAEREDVVSKRRLAALLSLEGDLLAIALTDPLPLPVVQDVDREALVARSRSTRLDVRAAAAASEAAQARVELERKRVFPRLDAGVALERPERGSSVDLVVGPSVSIELPVFDQNRAQISLAEYRFEELRKEHAALVADVGQEVRAAVDRAAAAARTARFVIDELLPQAEFGVALAQMAYELGDTTLLALLESQRAALSARRERIEMLLEASLSTTDVERACGSPLHSRSDDGAAAAR